MNFGPLAAEIGSLVWGTRVNFNVFHVLAALLHGTLVVGISQTLWHWTEGATYSAGRPSRYYISPISTEVTKGQICTKSGTAVDVADVINCDNTCGQSGHLDEGCEFCMWLIIAITHWQQQLLLTWLALLCCQWYSAKQPTETLERNEKQCLSGIVVECLSGIAVPAGCIQTSSVKTFIINRQQLTHT